jgi:hypothetical protein
LSGYDILSGSYDVNSGWFTPNVHGVALCAAANENRFFVDETGLTGVLSREAALYVTRRKLISDPWQVAELIADSALAEQAAIGRVQGRLFLFYRLSGGSIYMREADLVARQTLGAALLRAGDATGAEVAFRGDLKVFPRNSWGLLGLSESLKAQGREGDAKSVQREFTAAWKHADTKLDLAWF